MIVLVLLWSIGYFFANLFQCLPIESNWSGNGVSSTCVEELTMYISECWTDVIMDGKSFEEGLRLSLAKIISSDDTIASLAYCTKILC